MWLYDMLTAALSMKDCKHIRERDVWLYVDIHLRTVRKRKHLKVMDVQALSSFEQRVI